MARRVPRPVSATEFPNKGRYSYDGSFEALLTTKEIVEGIATGETSFYDDYSPGDMNWPQQMV